MKKVVIESPYAGDIEQNIKYARECMADCLRRGEAPIASHLLYTQDGILDDNIPEERKKGIKAGFVWGECADKVVFYTDLGWSSGMVEAYHYWKKEVEFRESAHMRGTELPNFQIEERTIYVDKRSL